MNENDPRLKQIENIQKIASVIAEYNMEQLIKKEKLGELSFLDMEDYFRVIIKHCNDLKKNQKLIELSEKSLTYLLNPCLSKIAGAMKAINDFELENHENPKQAITNYKNDLKNNYNVFIEGIARYLPLIVEKDNEDISRKIAEIESIKKETLNKAKEINKILEDSKTAAGKLGVSEHSQIFAEQAKEHLVASWWWMGATILTGMVTLGAAIWSIDWFMKDFEQLKVTGYAIQFGITKLVVFSIMYFTLVWVSRNYRSNRHNYIVNKHRQNALSTFKTFVDAVKEDPAIQNTILNKTTDCIFSHEISGYLPKEPESGPGIQNIFEALPKLNGKNA